MAQIPFLDGIDVAGNANISGNLHVIGSALTVDGLINTVNLLQLSTDFYGHNHDTQYAAISDLANYALITDLQDYVLQTTFDAHDHNGVYALITDLDSYVLQSVFNVHGHDERYALLTSLDDYVLHSVFDTHNHDTLYARITDLDNYVLKTTFDAHNHDDLYAPINHTHDGEFLPSTGGTMTGDLHVNAEVFDYDGNGVERSVSESLDLLLLTIPAPYEVLNSGSITSSTLNGRLADGSADTYTYDATHGIGDTISDITVVDPHYHVGGSLEFSNANEGSINVHVNGVIRYTLDLTQYSPDGTPGTSAPSSGYPAAGVRINVLEKHESFSNPAWFDIPPAYARGEASITVPVADLRNGINTIKVEHHDGVAPIGSSSFDLFYDAYSTVMTFSSQTMALNTVNNLRYLSGIPFAGTASTVDISFIVNNFFGGSFPTGQVIHIDSSDLGIHDDFAYTAGTGFTLPDPLIGESVTLSTTSVVNRTTKTAVQNPYVTLDADSNNSARNTSAVNVYGTVPLHMLFGSSSSSGNSEDHFSELYRIPVSDLDTVAASLMNSVPTGQFQSDTLLLSNELQVYAGSLIYPHDDYSGFMPGGADYSTATGLRSYGRAFNGMSPAEAGGVITVSGIDYSAISSGDVKMEMCIPGVSAWGDMLNEYLDPVSSDGMGCYFPAAGNGAGGVFGFFLGYNFADGGSANAFLLRITIAESAKNSITIGSISATTIA